MSKWIQSALILVRFWLSVRKISWKTAPARQLRRGHYDLRRKARYLWIDQYSRNIFHARERGKRTAGDILMEWLYTLDFGFIGQRSILISGLALCDECHPLAVNLAISLFYGCNCSCKKCEQ
jgi:hypothetical protein